MLSQRFFLVFFTTTCLLLAGVLSASQSQDVAAKSLSIKNFIKSSLSNPTSFESLQSSDTPQDDFLVVEKKWSTNLSTEAWLSQLKSITDPVDYENEIVQKLDQDGQASIVIFLKIDEKILDQEAEIKSIQDQVLVDINQSDDNKEVRRYKLLPYLRTTVDAGQFSVLVQSNLIKEIYLDRLVEPELFDSVGLIGGHSAWNSGKTGAGYAVAILDTGVDKNHPFLSGKIISEACYSNNLCPGGVTSSTAVNSGLHCSGANGCYHGTHVAGIAAGSGYSSGVAKGASIIAIQIYSRYDSASVCGYGNTPCVLSSTSKILSGLERVLELQQDSSFTTPIASANLSLGGYGYSDYCDDQYGFLKDVIDRLRQADVATVIASGNEGYTDRVSMPGCISSAVTVNASTKSQTIWTTGNSAFMVDLTAPGKSIYSSIPGGGYGYASGTSMAAPHVAGSFAIMKQACPEATIAQIESAMERSGLKMQHPYNGLWFPQVNLTAALQDPTFLSLCGIPKLSLSSQTASIRHIPPGQTQLSSISVLNTGQGNLRLTNIKVVNQIGNAFSLTTSSCTDLALASGKSCQLSFSFAPQVAQSYQAVLTFDTNDPDSPSGQVVLTGQSGNPILSLSRSSYNFGQVQLQTQQKILFELRNIGSGYMEVSQIGYSNPIALPFKVQNNNCIEKQILPGYSCSFEVSFQPITSITYLENFDLLTNVSSTPVTFLVQGQGVFQSLDISKSQHHFGSVKVGETKQAQVTMLNNGDVALSIGNLGSNNQLQAPFYLSFDNCSLSNLQPSQQCTFYVNFSPTQATTAVDTFDLGQLVPGSVHLFTVSGNGVLPKLEVYPKDSPIDFRFVNIGQQATELVVLENSGSGSMQVLSVAQSNPLSQPFSLEDNCSGQTLLPKEQCWLIVSFWPQQAGLYEDTFSVTTDIIGSSTTTISLQGQSTSPTAPIAHFLVERTIGSTPMRVSFEDGSLYAPTSWYWDFGDGQTSTVENPTHYYTQPGIYSVSLTVTNDQGTDTLERFSLIEVTQRVSSPISESEPAVVRQWSPEFINSLPPEIRQRLESR